MLDYTVENLEDKKILLLKGDLNIQNAEELKSILLSVLAETDRLVLNLENVTDADLSCLQLFCSAYKTATDSDKSLIFGSNCAEVFNEAVKAAGYNTSGCGISCKKSCIWAACKDANNN